MLWSRDLDAGDHKFRFVPAREDPTAAVLARPDTINFFDEG
jgi:hypothetical protein